MLASYCEKILEWVKMVNWANYELFAKFYFLTSYITENTTNELIKNIL